MRVVATKSTTDNLCNYCQLHIATCPKAKHLEFGNGIGNDNVIECSEFIHKGGCEEFIDGKPELGVFKSGKNN